jgi:plastocyanin
MGATIIVRRSSGVRTIVVVIAAVTFLLGAAVPYARAEDARVKIDNFTFSPEVLTIKRGTKVTFENHDDIPHTIVGVGGKFRSKPLDSDDKFSFTFDTAGDFAYFCGLHPHMKGKIVVSP